MVKHIQTRIDLSVLDHFVILALKGLMTLSQDSKYIKLLGFISLKLLGSSLSHIYLISSSKVSNSL